MFESDNDDPQSGPTVNENPAAQFLGNEMESTPSPTPAAVIPDPAIPRHVETVTVALSRDKESEALAEGLVNIGNTPINIPDLEGQLAGFELTAEEAGTLVTQFRQYKFFVEKGQATPPVFIS